MVSRGTHVSAAMEEWKSARRPLGAAQQGVRDEAPSASRDGRRVIRVQRDLTRVVRVLDPLLACKGE